MAGRSLHSVGTRQLPPDDVVARAKCSRSRGPATRIGGHSFFSYVGLSVGKACFLVFCFSVLDRRWFRQIFRGRSRLAARSSGKVRGELSVGMVGIFSSLRRKIQNYYIHARVHVARFLFAKINNVNNLKIH